MATIIINSYGWLTLNLLFTILPAKNDFTTHKKKKRKMPVPLKCMPTGPQVAGSHYWRQLEMMYMKNITSGESSPRQLFFH